MQLLQLSLVLGLGDEGFLYLTRAWAIFGCTVEARIPLDLCLSVPGDPSYWGCIYQTGEESHAEGVTKIVGLAVAGGHYRRSPCCTRRW